MKYATFPIINLLWLHILTLTLLVSMAGFLKSAFRNFLLITLGAIALAVLFSRSHQARDLLSPPGATLPPGVDLQDSDPENSRK